MILVQKQLKAHTQQRAWQILRTLRRKTAPRHVQTAQLRRFTHQHAWYETQTRRRNRIIRNVQADQRKLLRRVTGVKVIRVQLLRHKICSTVRRAIMRRCTGCQCCCQCGHRSVYNVRLIKNCQMTAMVNAAFLQLGWQLHRLSNAAIIIITIRHTTVTIHCIPTIRVTYTVNNNRIAQRCIRLWELKISTTNSKMACTWSGPHSFIVHCHWSSVLYSTMRLLNRFPVKISLINIHHIVLLILTIHTTHNNNSTTKSKSGTSAATTTPAIAAPSLQQHPRNFPASWILQHYFTWCMNNLITFVKNSLNFIKKIHLTRLHTTL